MTPESKVKLEIRKICEAYKILRIPIIGTGLTKKGISDIICCCNTAFIAIEAKATKESILSVYQARFLESVWHHKGFAFVVCKDSVEIFHELLKLFSSSQGNILCKFADYHYAHLKNEIPLIDTDTRAGLIKLTRVYVGEPKRLMEAL
jgi:hypothetical protein